MLRTIGVALVLGLSGCVSIVEGLGYTVVDEELVAIDKARDAATQKYVDETLPLVVEDRIRELGETLKRVSAKEQALLSGSLDEEDDE